MAKIAVVVNFVTSYRLAFYERLFGMSDLDVTVFCHQPPAGSSLHSVHQKLGARIRLIEGRFVGGEVLVLSRLPWRELLTSFDAVVIEGNPRYLSFALLATALRVLGKRVVLWTMVHSYRDSKRRRAIRLWWTRLFERVLVYSDREATYLRSLGFSGEVVGINNGLDQRAIAIQSATWESSLASWRAEKRLSNRRVVLSCARLERKNKFNQFLPVLNTLRAENPTLLWVIIGDGPDHDALRSEIDARNLAESVLLVGPLFQESQLAPWFLSAEFLVHPGAIGLTLLHAFGYGLPVLTHSNPHHHGPEFAAFQEGCTGLSYPEDDVAGLELAARQLLTEREALSRMAQQARAVVEDRFNVDVMLERFLQSLS